MRKEMEFRVQGLGSRVLGFRGLGFRKRKLKMEWNFCLYKGNPLTSEIETLQLALQQLFITS